LYLTSDRPPATKLETWGYSLLAKEWAEERNIAYDMPPWDVVKMVNSKSYSFSKSPLPGSRLIYSGDPIEPNTVLKSCFGAAGQGLISSDSPKAKKFCEEQWKRNLPVISEPWVKRICDFSTQWIISKGGEIAYLGVTLCKTTSSGAHQSNTAGMPAPPFVEEQKAVAEEVLEEIAQMGYFGEVGFDAMVHGNNELQPIVEINARKTMGFVTLMLLEQYPDSEVELAYIVTKEKGPLPTEIGQIKFSRQAIIKCQKKS
nr:[Butirosin acyl-carrier protein]--L-glutamate ligase [Chlamydiota bacterium]